MARSRSIYPNNPGPKKMGRTYLSKIPTTSSNPHTIMLLLIVGEFGHPEVLSPCHNLRSDWEHYLFERCPHDQMCMLCKGTIPKLTRPTLHNAMVTVGNGKPVYGCQFWHIFLEKNINSSKLFHLRMLNVEMFWCSWLEQDIVHHLAGNCDCQTY
jgi:hypothetical protein